VLSVTSTTVTLSADIVAPGVGSGDTITFSIGDVLTAGGVPTDATFYYTAAKPIDVGYVAQASLNATAQIVGVPAGQNVLAESNILVVQDFLGSASTQFVDGWVEIAISVGGMEDAFSVPDVFTPTDVFSLPAGFGPWQKFVPGVQLGQSFWFRLALETEDPGSIPYALSFNYQVQTPARIDHYQNRTVPTAGLTIVFTPDNSTTTAPFNGGPYQNNQPGAVPYVSVSWSNGSTGEYYVITALSLTSMTITFYNSSAVAIQQTGVNIDVEGF
jgi:hypothetical protein